MKKIALVIQVLAIVASGCASSPTSVSTRPMNSEEIQEGVQDKTEREQEQRLAKEWEKAREQLRKQLQAEQRYSPTEGKDRQVETPFPESKQPDAEWQVPQIESGSDFAYLRLFKPNNIQNGYGADILLKDELSEQELVSFVKGLAGSHDPVVIRIFTSHTAYAQEHTGNYGPEYDSDYILFYVRNFSDRGAYRGCDEIRWMQATGKFSSKAGTKTKF